MIAEIAGIKLYPNCNLGIFRNPPLASGMQWEISLSIDENSEMRTILDTIGDAFKNVNNFRDNFTTALHSACVLSPIYRDNTDQKIKVQDKQCLVDGLWLSYNDDQSACLVLFQDVILARRTLARVDHELAT
ncbi:MAG: hypothetical protein OEQ29_06875 [Alphaproteobacteria bacterium]|nr:hypothetical protein [Alphaproteobacteria bacterium]